MDVPSGYDHMTMTQANFVMAHVAIAGNLLGYHVHPPNDPVLLDLQ